MFNPLLIIPNLYHRMNARLVEYPFFKLLRELLKSNITKTLYFNFKMFPFHVALRLPALLYGKIHFYSLDGKIQIDCPLRYGLIQIGKTTDYFGERYKSTIGIHGGGYMDT